MIKGRTIESLQESYKASRVRNKTKTAPDHDFSYAVHAVKYLIKAGFYIDVVKRIVYKTSGAKYSLNTWRYIDYLQHRLNYIVLNQRNY